MSQKNYHQFQDTESSTNYALGEAFTNPELSKKESLSQQQQQQYNYPPQPFQNQPLPQQNSPMLSHSQQQPIPQQLYYPAMSIPNSLANLQNQPQQILQIQAQPMTNLIISNQPKSRFSEQLYCVRCKAFIPTEIAFKPGLGAIIVGSIIAIFGGWLGCCLIPCCLEDCKDAIHTCPRCGNELGSKPFLTN